MKQTNIKDFIKENKILSNSTNSARIFARATAMLYTSVGKIMDLFFPLSA